MEAANFTENFLKQMFRKKCSWFMSSHLVVLFENYVTDFFSYALLKFLTNLLKTTAEVASFLITLQALFNLLSLVATGGILQIVLVTSSKFFRNSCNELVKTLLLVPVTCRNL